MTFGLCAGHEEGRAAIDAGFDYLEVPASGFAGFEATWDPSPYRGLPVRATNLFFGAGLTIHDRGHDPYDAYVHRTIERAATLGVETMVIGSGSVRRARPTESVEDGETRFVEAVAELQAIAAPHGIRIAPEALNREETNVGVDLGTLAWSLHEAELGHTADSYHVLREWDLDGRPDAVALLWDRAIILPPAHVHLGPIDRGMPRADDPMLVGFAGELVRGMDYDGRVSLEVSRDSGFDLAGANRAVRALFSPATVAGSTNPLRRRDRFGAIPRPPDRRRG